MGAPMTPRLDGIRRKCMAHNFPSGIFPEEIYDMIFLTDKM
jgi:hypothetical protein